jgi:hypothetical protein
MGLIIFLISTKLGKASYNRYVQYYNTQFNIIIQRINDILSQTEYSHALVRIIHARSNKYVLLVYLAICTLPPLLICFLLFRILGGFNFATTYTRDGVAVITDKRFIFLSLHESEMIDVELNKNVNVFERGILHLQYFAIDTSETSIIFMCACSLPSILLRNLRESA